MRPLKTLRNISTAGAILAASTLFSVASADLSGVTSGDYASDPSHAYINFSYNHLGFSNPTLSFDDFTIDMNLDTEDPTKTTVSVSVDTNSILTGSAIWKEHLTGENFFDTSKYPAITFQSSSVESTGDSTYAVSGDITIKDVTKPVTFNITINGAGPHPRSKKPIVGIEATAEILRSEFGMGNAVPFVSDEVALHITSELVGSN